MEAQTTQTKSNGNSINEQLTRRNKWCYTVGATGRDMAYALISMFLITYVQYTMDLTTAQYGAISAIIILCLIWDAFNDPMMGIIVENSHFKLGKYRPWILLGVVLNVIVIVLLFTVRLEGWGFVAFFGVSYLLWGMTFTMNDIAYWGMLPSLSSNPKERTTLVTLMSIFICIGQFSVAGALPIFVAGNAVNAYRVAALIISSCFLLFQLLTFFGVKERPRDKYLSQAKLGLKDIFKIFKRNDQLIVMFIAALLYFVGCVLLIYFVINFFYFEFGYSGGGLMTIFTVMFAIGTLLSQITFPTLTKHFTRKKLLRIMTWFIVLGYGVFLAFGYILPKNVILLDITGVVLFYCQGIVNMLIIVMLNNTIEYDEYKHGERHDSVISAVRSFTAKLSSAINQGIVALVLIISGIYSISTNISNLEIEAGKNLISKDEVMLQADSFINSAEGWQTFILRCGIVFIPVIVLCTCSILIRKKYIIDEAKYDEIVAELNHNTRS